MEILINDKFSFNKPFLRDIIKKNVTNGRKTMLNITSATSMVLYAIVTESDYIALSKKQKPKNQILFTEYRIQKPKTGQVEIAAEIDISKMLDMLNPNELKQIKNYEKQCLNSNMQFNNDKEVISSYMKVNKLNLVRYCKTVDENLTNLKYIVYKLHDISCIKRFYNVE